MCGLSIRIGDEWVTKWDGAENTDIEGVKGGLSGSMKRAGVQWGIGRYLYDLDAGWANVHPNGKHSGKTKETKKGASDGEWFNWDPPQLPPWALPQGHTDSDEDRAALKQQVERIRALVGRKKMSAKQYLGMKEKLDGTLFTKESADAAETWLETLPEILEKVS